MAQPEPYSLFSTNFFNHTTILRPEKPFVNITLISFLVSERNFVNKPQSMAACRPHPSSHSHNSAPAKRV
jgi:hypothetical protein